MNKLRLNVGSGQRKFSKPWWTNVDCQAKWNPDVIADARSMMFEDGSADMIVLHHMIEHFGCGEADPVIRECFRILEPGGSLIVTVPDFPALCKGWFRGQITDQIFFTNVYGAYMGDEADRHKFGFTAGSLTEMLDRSVGGHWSHIRSFDWRKIEGADIAKDWWILGCEAIK